MQFDTKAVGKIAVMSDGSVKYDGEVVSLSTLLERVAALKLKNGVVWYYREAPEQNAPAISSAVIKIIVDHKLPISFSTQSDYSTVALPDGTVRPRI